ncbi:MAG: STAS domain-containing protein [Planctomycetota bacterium]
MSSWIRSEPLPRLIGGLLIRPRGHIRAATSEEFREHVNGLLADGLTTWLVVDLSEVDSIDSSTAGYLLNLHDKMSQRGGSLALADLSPAVRVVIESIGLMTFFTVTETVQDAVEEFRSR